MYHNMKEIGFCRTIKWIFYKKTDKAKYNKQLLEWLYNENKNTLEKYRKINISLVSKDDFNKIIWVFWWQGLESMPKLIRACYESVLEYKEDYTVVLLTKENLKDYVTLSNDIINKFNRNFISITHLSDLIRVKLLHEYGGIWIDASIMLTEGVSQIVGKNGFSTGKGPVDNKYISQQKWTVFFWSNISGLGCDFFALIEDILDQYWRKHNFMVEYLLMDYIIYLCYENIPWVKKLLDSVPFNNSRMHELCKIINTCYSAEKYCEITNNTYLHKLSYKIKLEETTADGKRTFYGYIINRFLNNQ